MAETSIGFDLTTLVRECAVAEDEAADRALAEGLRQGIEEAYENLIARYQQPVFNLVYRLVENPADTGDVVQEVFLKVFRYVGTFRGQSSLKTWIYRIAVNEARNRRRWFRRRGGHEVALETENDAPGRSVAETLRDPGESPYDAVLGAETRTLIEQELAKLKWMFRQAVVLRDMEELGYEEIAEILGVSLGTVKSRILRGREALRRRLRERLGQAGSDALHWSPQPAEQD